MRGEDLIAALGKRLAAQQDVKTVSRAEIASHLNITAEKLGALAEKPNLTPLQVADLIDRAAAKAVTDVEQAAIRPIIEFYGLDPVYSSHGVKFEMFSSQTDTGQHPYIAGIQDRLKSSHGIYIFYDSRGRAIYVGKAVLQTLWKEMNLAFNRDRKDYQQIKVVEHPSKKVRYRPYEEQHRRIGKLNVQLSYIASYVSAYEVSKGLISTVEALLIRGFANDLLNTRMEKI